MIQETGRSETKVMDPPCWGQVARAHSRLKNLQERYAREMEQLVVSKSLLTLRSLEILAGSVEQLHDQFFLSLHPALVPTGPTEPTAKRRVKNKGIQG